MTISEKCRDYLHDQCKGCAGCTCHPDRARQAKLRAHAQAAGVKPFHAVDLMAHLRTLHGHHVPVSIPLDVAAAATELVIDLGWRPTWGEGSL